MRTFLNNKLVPALLCLMGVAVAYGAPPRTVVAASTAVAKPADSIPDVPLPVAYNIEARLDVSRKTLDGVEILRYRNYTGRALDRFPFHLYLNAFQPDSTFMAEVRRDHPNFRWKEKWHGATEIKSIAVLGVNGQGEACPPNATLANGADNSKKPACSAELPIRYLHPDDDNQNDRTVFEVQLPRAVPPGGEVSFRIEFHEQLPEIFARTGYHGDFFMGAQWFPKVGVWWQGAWNCHQFHANTEFFADFGDYDVKLTLPQDYVVGTTGVEVLHTPNPKDGTKTSQFRAHAVHDFAWAASPHFEEVLGEFNGGAGPVRLRLLMQPGHVEQAARYFTVLQQTMQRFDQWYGPYPYPQITVIDPPKGGRRAGGMEYPTLITAGAYWSMPSGVHLPEIVIAHEFGHQYWYGMVATNEFEDAWLDEGINSYSEAKVLDSIYGTDRSVLDFAGITLGEAGMQRMSYARDPDTDPLVRAGWLFLNRAAYTEVTYGKTATVLLTLEKLVGEATVQHALRTYFQRYRFTHPTREDFLKTVEEVSGQDLRWYFNQAVFGTNVLDYEVLSVSSNRPDWAQQGASERQESTGNIYYTSTVLLRRKGDFIFPVDLLVRFENGQTVRERWDGADRWIRYTYHGTSRVASAEIDPVHEVWLDLNAFNNSYTREPNRSATTKLLNYWVFLTQIFSQILAWLV